MTPLFLATSALCLYLLATAGEPKQPPGLPQVGTSSWSGGSRITRRRYGQEGQADVQGGDRLLPQGPAPRCRRARHADVKYDPYKRNVLDIWQVKADTPTPMLIHFPGGDFAAGHKADANPDPYVRPSVSVVSANYRFV